MKRIRATQCAGQLLRAQSIAPAPALVPLPYRARPIYQTIRSQSSSAALQGEPVSEEPVEPEPQASKPLPSPPLDRARGSAKLAALHARLSLPENLPLETLARTLIDPSADPNPNFNNANLSFIGGSLINFHGAETLIAQYPRLPQAIVYEAMRGYAGPQVLARVARSWGVEEAAAPGEEVDSGLLQWSSDPEKGVKQTKWGWIRKESVQLDKFKWRRGMSSRVVMDDVFGDPIHDKAENPLDPSPEDVDLAARAEAEFLRDSAHYNFVRAVIGAIYIHSGRESARSFINAHLLSRKLPMHKLFKFKLPTRELAMLCAREAFESPVARLLSETGRLSRTPVFVVGIFSGKDQLGEGSGPSLDVARINAAMNALKAWYLYSPGKVNLPSDTIMDPEAKYKPLYIDMGEIV